MNNRLSKCKICRTPYKKWSITQKTCTNPECAIELMRQEKARKARKAHLEAKVKARSRAKWVSLAQQAFNAFIRKRDEHLPCICCGKWPKETGKYGGDWDAGHFKTVGGYPELRFNENNCHKQLKSCNAGSGKYTAKGKTVSEEYRERLIIKIGLEAVEELERYEGPKKYTIDQLQAIIKEYKQKIKEITCKSNV